MVSVMLCPCILCVALLVYLFVLCVCDFLGGFFLVNFEIVICLVLLMCTLTI